MVPTDGERTMTNNHGALGISNVFQALKNNLSILSSFAIFLTDKHLRRINSTLKKLFISYNVAIDVNYKVHIVLSNSMQFVKAPM